MAAQLSYQRLIELAYHGNIYAMHPKDTISRSIETPAGIGFGVATSRGTDPDNQAIIGGTDFLGITVRELAREGLINTGAISYRVTETAAIMRYGYMWLDCPDACVPADPAKYDNITGIITSGVAGVGETQLVGAYWDTTASAGQIAVLRTVGTDTLAGS